MQEINFTSIHKFLASAIQQPWTAVYLKIIAISLWQGLTWSIWLLFGGILCLQILPYTLLRSHFILKPEDTQVLNSLLSTEILLLSILILLLVFKK